MIRDGEFYRVGLIFQRRGFSICSRALFGFQQVLAHGIPLGGWGLSLMVGAL